MNALYIEERNREYFNLCKEKKVQKQILKTKKKNDRMAIFQNHSTKHKLYFDTETITEALKSSRKVIDED